MSDLYKLVFRGEVLDGQHPAVVRKRLGQAADFDDAVLDKLFSGRPVILKRSADTATAARFQALFRKAGARLRVLPVDDADTAGPAPDRSGEPELPAVPAAGEPDTAAAAQRPLGLDLLPPGADVLREEERSVWEPREVDTSGLALEAARFLVAEEAPPAEGPDVSHLTVAEAGSELGPRRQDPPNPVPAPAFSLAAPGERLAPNAATPVPAVSFAELRFEVAPVGVDLDQRKQPQAPAVPDVSHLELRDPD